MEITAVQVWCKWHKYKKNNEVLVELWMIKYNSTVSVKWFKYVFLMSVVC